MEGVNLVLSAKLFEKGGDSSVVNSDKLEIPRARMREDMVVTSWFEL